MKNSRTINESVLLQVIRTYMKFNPRHRQNITQIQDYLKKKKFKYLKDVIEGMYLIKAKLNGEGIELIGDYVSALGSAMERITDNHLVQVISEGFAQTNDREDYL
jgi:hypothetical protein